MIEIGKNQILKIKNFASHGAYLYADSDMENTVLLPKLEVPKGKEVGDEIVVKSLGYDNRGRLNLSRKEALFGSEKKKSSKEEVKENKEEKIEKKSRKGLFRKGD